VQGFKKKNKEQMDNKEKKAILNSLFKIFMFPCDKYLLWIFNLLHLLETHCSFFNFVSDMVSLLISPHVPTRKKVEINLFKSSPKPASFILVRIFRTRLHRFQKSSWRKKFFF